MKRPQATHDPIGRLGDYNLVGSRKPLDIIKAQGFDEFLLKSPVDGSAASWRGISPRESFWPGRLDYVTFDTSKLRAVGGYSMNTEVLRKLNPELGIDAPVSDHAMLVVDLKPAA